MLRRAYGADPGSRNTSTRHSLFRPRAPRPQPPADTPAGRGSNSARHQRHPAGRQDVSAKSGLEPGLAQSQRANREHEVGLVGAKTGRSCGWAAKLDRLPLADETFIHRSRVRDGCMARRTAPHWLRVPIPSAFLVRRHRPTSGTLRLRFTGVTHQTGMGRVAN
jgi:hypothetical protein